MEEEEEEEGEEDDDDEVIVFDFRFCLQSIKSPKYIHLISIKLSLIFSPILSDIEFGIIDIIDNLLSNVSPKEFIVIVEFVSFASSGIGDNDEYDDEYDDDGNDDDDNDDYNDDDDDDDDDGEYSS